MGVGPRIWWQPLGHEHMFARSADGTPHTGVYNRPWLTVPGDWSNGEDGGLQNRKSGFDSLVPRSNRRHYDSADRARRALA